MGTLQLEPAWPVETPGGPGFAVLAIDYSQEHYLMLVVALDRPYLTEEPGEIHIFDNRLVRFQTNHTLGRLRPKEGGHGG